MSITPQVPNIAPASPGAAGPSEDISSLLGQVAQQAQAPLPPQYLKGTTIAEPRIQPVAPHVQQNDHRAPINNQATSLRQARTQNAFASLTNVVGKAGEMIQQKKQDLLKEDLKTVMRAKDNIANAKSVLEQDPNNEMAKQVIQANTKSLEAILTDPKKQKQLSKALDLSFTDMDKNKTPEVRAYQAAAKEHKEAGQYTSNNPAEAKIAAQAAGAGGGQQPPASSTPHADAALAKDLPSMQANPNYAVALKDKQESQKRLEQYIIPRAIQAETQRAVQAMKDENANARVEYKATIDLKRDADKQLAALKLQNQKAKDQMAQIIRRDSDALLRTQMDINARFKLAADKRLDPNTSLKIKTDGLAKIDQSLHAITAERMSLSTQLQNETDPERKQVLEHLLDYNTLKAKATNEYRQKVATDVYGRVGETQDGRTTSTGSSSESVGSNLSDETDDDSSDDSDSY